MRYVQLERMGLPANLVEMVADGTLVERVEDARRTFRQLNALLDDWERRNPEAAKVVQWAQERQTWKDAGRPEAPWYEMLWTLEKRSLGFGAWDIYCMHSLHARYTTEYQKRRRAEVLQECNETKS